MSGNDVNEGDFFAGKGSIDAASLRTPHRGFRWLAVFPAVVGK